MTKGLQTLSAQHSGLGANISAFYVASMLAGNSIKWTDPATWPWIVYAWLVFSCLGWLKPAWRWLQRRRAASWPIAEGHIESVEVTSPKAALLSTSRSSSYGAEVGYSYSVAGGLEAGWYRRDFPTEPEAQDFVRELKGKPLAIHYNPNKPSDSHVSETSLEVLLGNRAPVLDTESVLAQDFFTERSRKFLWFFTWIAAIGLVVSLWVHLGAVMGRRAPQMLFGILHVGIFVVWIPAMVTAVSMVGYTHRKDFWKAVLKGSPEWMRYMVYGFGAYALINFFVFITKATGGSNRTNTPAVVWRGFSGHWMAFYSAAFAILYSAAHAKQSWGCPNGHAVPPNASYCTHCGQPVIRGLQG